VSCDTSTRLGNPNVKVVFLTEQYPPVIWDGVGTYTATIAPALAELGHEVHVVACQGRRVTDEIHDGVFVHRRPLVRIPISRYLGRYARFLRGHDYPRDSISLRLSLAVSYWYWMWRLRLQPDVIETQESETRALVFALRHVAPLVIRLHTPAVLDIRLRHDRLSWRAQLADRLDRVSADRAHMLVAPSPLLVDVLRRFDWIRARDPAIIPYPFDPTIFLDVGEPDRRSDIALLVGRIEHRKGQDVLLDAVAQLRATGLDVKVVLAGASAGELDGLSARAAIEGRAARLGVPCELAGHVAYEALPELYARARVVAVPSRFESFSLTALEAIAAGRPVVISATTGAASFVTRWGAGVVVDPDDAKGLADALRPYLDSPTLATETGQRGRRALVEELKPSEIAGREVALYEAARDEWARRKANG
jgi:glycogen(starch) synthase